eukprot:2304530-Pyramimonas_sp.AAC.1
MLFPAGVRMASRSVPGAAPGPQGAPAQNVQGRQGRGKMTWGQDYIRRQNTCEGLKSRHCPYI